MNKVTNKREQGSTLNSVALRLTPIAAGCAILLSTASGSVFAQEAVAVKDEAPAVDTRVVTGIRRGIEAAISIKKNNSSIVEAISAEDIGKLPDSSVAESIARLPGVTAPAVFRDPDSAPVTATRHARASPPVTTLQSESTTGTTAPAPVAGTPAVNATGTTSPPDKPKAPPRGKLRVIK